MGDGIEIRQSLPGDMAAIEKLYPDAFPDEDLLPLVKELLDEEPIVLSLVATLDKDLAGHGIFTTCALVGSNETVALLGPLAVARARQRQGIGKAIVEAGLQRLESAGVTQVHVLGDPAYYGRLGFVPEDGIVPPYPLPAEWAEAWQAKRFRCAKPHLRGKLSPPRPWLQPDLWTS